MPSVDLILPFPPSVNHIWLRSRAGGVYLAPSARNFRNEVAVAVYAARSREPLLKKPITGNVNVRVRFRPPDRRIRDLDNYNKALWDALTHCGVWTDDHQVITLDSAWLGFTCKAEAKTELTLTWEC